MEALEVSNQVGDRNRVALVLTSLGAVACRAGRPQEAIEHLRQAEAMCDELGDKLVLAEALRGLGKSHLLVGDLVKARDYIGRAVDLFAAVRSKVHLGLALRTLGEITAAGGWGSAHSRSAGEYFARSAAMFEQTGSEMELARTLRIYAAFLRSNPDFDADPRAQAEARRMEERAERTFARIAAAPLPRASFSSVPPKDGPP